MMPRRLIFRGDLLLAAGRDGDGFVYTQPATGTVFVLRIGVVSGSGGSAVRVALPDGSACKVAAEDWAGRPPVRGDRCLVGPVRTVRGQTIAEAAWLFTSPRSGVAAAPSSPPSSSPPKPPVRRPSPRGSRASGVLVEFHKDRGFGRLITTKGKSVFADGRAFADGIRPCCGARYEFELVRAEKGLAARDIATAD